MHGVPLRHQEGPDDLKSSDALEDAVLYLLPDATFARLRAEYPEFGRFFAQLGGRGRGDRAGRQPQAAE